MTFFPKEASQDWLSDTGFSGHLPQGYKAPHEPCFLPYQALGPPQFSGLCSLNFSYMVGFILKQISAKQRQHCQYSIVLPLKPERTAKNWVSFILLPQQCGSSWKQGGQPQEGASATQEARGGQEARKSTAPQRGRELLLVWFNSLWNVLTSETVQVECPRDIEITVLGFAFC